MIVMYSIIRSIYYFSTSRIHFPSDFKDKTVRMEDGLEFKIFRHMHIKSGSQTKTGSILIVRFKFKKFSHRANIRLSRIPILLIAGFPGFRDKLWMIDWKTDCWQGIYYWESVDAIEKYKKSFVLGIMNKRADDHSISYEIIKSRNINDYLQSILL